MNQKTIAIILLSFICFISCIKDNITEPEPEPGRRDYVWTVDTIDIYSPIGKIWGSSPTDVWAINESDYYHSIWHYDGISWKTDGQFRFILPHAIWGFSNNEVYIGGQNGKIWKYNGNNWEPFAELSTEGTEFIAFENIWGETSNDLYAVGNGPDENLLANYSIITHLNNNSWTILNTDNLIGNVVHLYKNSPDGKIYFRLTKNGGIEHIDSTLIYEKIKNNYHKIYGDIETKGLKADISLINHIVYFILGNELAIRNNNKFKVILNIENPNFYQRIWGRTSKDIFLLMTDGLAHYNGENVEYLFYFKHAEDKPRTQIYGAALFNNEVFFTVYEPPTHLNLIYHGTLE